MKKVMNVKLAGFFVLLFFWAFAAGADKTQAAVALSDTSVTLYLGEDGKDTCQLSVSGVPDGAEAVFRSGNKKIAAVTSKTGTVTAVAPGKAVITCTVTEEDGTKTVCKATIYVKDNIKSIALGLADASLRCNELKKHKDYELSYTCKTAAGTNQNSGNYLYYEVLNTKGRITQYASVTQDGVFRATKSGTYTVKVYCFRGSAYYSKWAENREKYASYVLAEDDLTLTVTLKNFAVTDRELYGWNLTLPEEYLITAAGSMNGVVTYSINAVNSEKSTAASNIQVRIDTLEQTPEFEELKNSMLEVYTKTVIADSWKSAYNAGSATVKNLKREVVTINGRDVMKISYDIVLKNMIFTFENSADIKISRLAYYNTVYTWYDGLEHLTVNVTDAYEGIQPNINEAAEKMVENLQRR